MEKGAVGVEIPILSIDAVRKLINVCVLLCTLHVDAVKPRPAEEPVCAIRGSFPFGQSVCEDHRSETI